MLASEMIAVIQYVEKTHHGITQMSTRRISFFQLQNLPVTQGVEYDSAFYDFAADMERVMGRMYLPTKKKILNNWYLWAKQNKDAFDKIKPMKRADSPIDWLIRNEFRIEHKRFAENATEEAIEKVQAQMPKYSDLHIRLKYIADTKYAGKIGKRGFSYPYLVRVVAGFSEAWG